MIEILRAELQKMEVGYRRKIEDARSGMVTLGPEESFCPKCFGDMKVQKTRPRYIATIKYGCIDLRILTLACKAGCLNIVLAHVVGKRTLFHAIKLLEEVKRVTVDMPVLFASDQLDQYQKAILHVYGIWEQPPRKGKVGRIPKPRLVPPENLVYVQVVKKYEKNRISEESRKIVFGTSEQVERILADSVVSKKINTSHIERNNGTVRHIDSRCVRKTYRFSKIMKNHELQLQLSIAYYHLCRPHRTLTKRYGKPTTPFMAAGFTDHTWTMRELLKFKPKIHGS